MKFKNEKNAITKPKQTISKLHGYSKNVLTMLFSADVATSSSSSKYSVASENGACLGYLSSSSSLCSICSFFNTSNSSKYL